MTDFARRCNLARALAWGAAGWLASVVGAGALAQATSPEAAPQAAPQQAASAQAPVAPAPAPAASIPPAPARPAAKSPGKTQVTTGPLWRELTPSQQQSLAPLSGTWNTLNEAQKRKWLALSQNFPKMAPAEQEKLHSRMTGWAALSPTQRSQARLNFGATRKISPDDKKAKWEAYQALSAEEKHKLAAGAAKPPATAAAVKPVGSDKLAKVPKPRTRTEKAPRIAAAPNQVDHNTLLPQQQPAPTGQN